MPGNYSVILTVDGKKYIQSLTVKMDPRIKTSFNELQQQHDISYRCYEERLRILKASGELQNLRTKIKHKLLQVTGNSLSTFQELDNEAASLQLTPKGSNEVSFENVNGSLATVFNILQEADEPATSQVLAASKKAEDSFMHIWDKWIRFSKKVQLTLAE